MFTHQARQLLDQAKRDAWAQGAAELKLGVVLAATASHAEGRVLLAHCLGLPADRLREQYPAPQFQSTFSADKLALAKETQALLGQAHSLAQQAPDRTHPGLIALRHLVCALAMSRAAIELLSATPMLEKDALQWLSAWYDDDAARPELGALSEQLRALRAHLLSRVFGQDHAVHAFIEGLFNAEVVAQADAQRRSPRAIFVFAGPAGVGKTYLAELGAASLGRPFKRFDMSTYSDHQQYMQLIGFPPSFQAARPGVLTGFVAEHPNAFLLFDEIEKAHLTTVNLFLQILDAGRLEDKYTDADVAFRETVIIFTTNAGASLYDRPNATGVNAANAAFHRRTLLDALRTEKGPHGEPLFPEAICSRLSTGYPVLFNHLGINELERIAQTEVERVAGLIQQQYYKTVTFDDALPLSLVLREGASADARGVRSQSGIFVQTELFKLAELYTKRRLQTVWEETDTLHFGLDVGQESGEVRGIFEPSEKPKVLLLAAEALGTLYRQHLPDVEWLVAGTAPDALQQLAATDVDMVLLDIWLGHPPAAFSMTGTVAQFDYAPLGARTLADGQACLQQIRERLPHLPVYLLSLVGDEAETIDERLFVACVRNGGARGVLTTAFTNNNVNDWQTQCEQLACQLRATTRRLRREQKVQALSQESKVLAFDTVPTVNRAQRQVTIRLRNLHLSRAVAARDAGELIEAVERPVTRFEDVFGADTAKEALQFVVAWLRNPRRYAALGVHPPKGILLTGLPGTGKTMLARALAGESEAAFLVASGTDFVTIWQGSGPQNIRNLFARARRYAPSIVFIDEIDAVGKKRTGAEGGSRAEESTLNQLLTELDGFGTPTLRPVIVLAATNLAEHLDEALRRRFDRELEVPLPDRAARAAYLRHEFLNRQSAQVSKQVLDTLAGRSAGMTISDLRRVVNEAAVMAAQRESPLTDDTLEDAFEKLRMGEASKTPDLETLERIAWHEAGHALIGWLTGNPPVQVTIVGRGRAGGYVEREAQEEKLIYTRADLEHMICQAMGGRAAEVLFYGEAGGLSTGVASDLHSATRWAERMIREFGMSSEVGQAFVDERYLRDGPLAVRVSEAAERIVHAQLDQAGKLLQAHRQPLERLACELLSKNRLSRSDLEQILAQDHELKTGDL